ncbi:uncharacterized protein OCT59_005649 [Rhizophagus irregularis]|uniref:uncharacterized protein n=1 Tax=Rhizophagus irregularis TaxID=588596 RepID=UPI00331CC9A0|nr:hypothetical protein OCT59_005649 [Rhizophagus irregularis]
MVSARLFALDWYWRDPSLCISIGWDLWSSIGWDFWIGIISWKLGFLNKYRLKPLETKPVYRLQPLETKPVLRPLDRSMAFWVFPEWNFEALQLFR